MSRANQEAILLGLASLSMFTSVFAKPLGLPDPWNIVPIFVGFCFLFLMFRLRRKTKIERAGKLAPLAPVAQRKKVFWIIALCLIAGSVTSIPLMPYTVENFQPWIYYYLIPAQIIFLMFFLTWYWKKLTRAGTAETPSEGKG